MTEYTCQNGKQTATVIAETWPRALRLASFATGDTTWLDAEIRTTKKVPAYTPARFVKVE